MNVPAVTSCARTDKCTEVRKTVLESFYKKNITCIFYETIYFLWCQTLKSLFVYVYFFQKKNTLNDPFKFRQF